MLLIGMLVFSAMPSMAFVGDIDFTPSGDMAKLILRVEAGKSLTLKSGKGDGKAVFTNGSLILSGAKTIDGRNIFHFENIIFDGAIRSPIQRKR